jgi:quinol monooxygenase YgiN
MLIRHVQYTLKPGKAEQFWKFAKETESQAASMEGVGVTHRFVDPDNPNTIFSYLEFDNAEAAAALQESPLMKEYGAKIAPLIASWDVYMQYTVSKAESLKPLTE